MVQVRLISPERPVGPCAVAMPHVLLHAIPRKLSAAAAAVPRLTSCLYLYSKFISFVDARDN